MLTFIAYIVGILLGISIGIEWSQKRAATFQVGGIVARRVTLTESPKK